MAAMADRFSYPRPNLIVSSDGFSVEVRGRNTVLYAETDKTIEVFAEQVVIDEPTIIVRRADIRVWQARGREIAVSESERERVLANIRGAFDWKGWKLAVE
jgi:hypothetical protein